MIGLGIGLSGITWTDQLCDDESYSESEEVVPSATNDRCVRSPLDEPIRVQLRPLAVTGHTYSQSWTGPENIFPPSSRSWHGRLRRGASRALFIVQRVLDDARLWLTVMHPVSGKMFEKHFIHPFEVWTLLMDAVEEHKRRWLDAVAPPEPDSVALSMMQALERPLTWDEITALTNGMVSPTFVKEESAWNDLEQLLPASAQGEFRQELKAFLVWSLREPDLQVDPIELMLRLTHLRYFKSLLEVHYRFLVQGTRAPSYLQLLESASERSEDERVASETLHEHTFTRLLYEAMSGSPDWRDIAAGHCESLKRSKSITLRLPISKEQATRSRASWMERFALFTLGFHLRAHVRPEAFGLKRVLYLGNAYRWPHPHLSWSADLETPGIYPLQLHVLLLPLGVLEQARRHLPSLLEVDWSARAYNPHLIQYSKVEGQSLAPLILDASRQEHSHHALMCKYGSWKGRNPHMLTQSEARILDSSISRLDLALLEMESGRIHWGVSEDHALRFFEEMRRIGAVQLFYEFKETHLPRPLFILAQGEAGGIRSLIRAVLDHSPSAVVFAGKDWRYATLISTLDRTSRDILSQRFPVEGQEMGLDIRCYVPSSFRNYTADVLQRLRRPDGSWFDDISGLLTQSRLLKIEGGSLLNERN